MGLRQITRREVMQWLLQNGFEEKKRGPNGHAHFAGYGIKITVPAHGRQDLIPGIIAQIRRQLRGVGLQPEW